MKASGSQENAILNVFNLTKIQRIQSITALRNLAETQTQTNYYMSTPKRACDGLLPSDTAALDKQHSNA